jgi:hypothetical protein
MVTLILLSFSCSGFASGFNCVWRCQGFVTAVAIRCGPMASPRIGRSHGSLPCEQ